MHDVVRQLAGGQLTAITIMVWTLFSFLVSVVAGAAAGVSLAGKDLGTTLAAAMGAMYGPLAAVPGILAGLVLLALI